MAMKFAQVSVTTSPKSVTELAGITNGRTMYRSLTVAPTGGTANTVYGGPSNVANTPANAGFFATATRPCTIGIDATFGVNTDSVYLVATTGTTVTHLTLVA